MKALKGIKLILLIALFFSCGSKQELKEETKQVKLVSNIIEVDTKFFIEKIAKLDNRLEYLGDKPAIIDFYATWCGPCRKQTPILEELSKKYKDSLYIYKIDVDNSPDLANTLNVSAIPTLIFFSLPPTRPVMMQGFMTKEEVESYIQRFLLKN